MNDLDQKVRGVLQAYATEVELWREVPDDVEGSRSRLYAFLWHMSKEPGLRLVVDNEIALLWRKIRRMKAQRLGESIH